MSSFSTEAGAGLPLLLIDIAHIITAAEPAPPQHLSIRQRYSSRKPVPAILLQLFHVPLIPQQPVVFTAGFRIRSFFAWRGAQAGPWAFSPCRQASPSCRPPPPRHRQPSGRRRSRCLKAQALMEELTMAATTKSRPWATAPAPQYSPMTTSPSKATPTLSNGWKD